MTPTHSAAAPVRRTLRFSTEGMAARDAVLFKSFVRLLAHRTEHNWIAADAPCEVLVAAQGTKVWLPPPTQVLAVGSSHRGERHFVRFPFHADELEQALNTLGRTVAAASSPPAAAREAVAPTSAIRLLRWPPATLLTNASRIRLATLLAAGALPQDALQQRSGCDTDTCSRFLAELSEAGLLVIHNESGPAREPARPVEAGLLDRIRRRLGRVATLKA